MKNYINEYIKTIDEKIKEGKNLDTVRQEHLIKIQFFQHERLIHLLVTLFFALFLFLFIITIQFVFSAVIGLILIFIILIFYIIHYYKLENGVQYMYKQYDEISEKINNKKNKWFILLYNKSVLKYLLIEEGI